MKAYLINPETQSISTVNYSGDFNEIYTHINAGCFDVARINDKGDGIFVDDEGLLKPQKYFFKHSGYANWLAGRGLVLGCDENGDSCEPSVSIEELRQCISFGINLQAE